MIEYILIGLCAFLGVLMGALCSLYILIRWLNDDNLSEILEKMLSDEKVLQKAYYASGVIGQGFVTGSGLKGVLNKGGKPKIKDIALQMGLEYLSQFIPQNKQNTQEPTNQPFNKSLE